MEQKATWLQVRQQRPDYVFLWGWGVMNSTSIKEAIAVSYPRLQMFGVLVVLGAEPDVLPAEQAAKGYNGITLGHSSEKDRPVHKDIDEAPLRQGQGHRDQEGARSGSVMYNRGMISAMLLVESIKSAQGKYGKRVVTGEEVRWGAENLNLDAGKLKAIGFEGIVQPLKTSCRDHDGVAPRPRPHLGRHAVELHVRLVRGGLQVPAPADRGEAKKYAAEKKITPRDCSKEK